jgi:hypothetical protein
MAKRKNTNSPLTKTTLLEKQFLGKMDESLREQNFTMRETREIKIKMLSKFRAKTQKSIESKVNGVFEEVCADCLEEEE